MSFVFAFSLALSLFSKHVLKKKKIKAVDEMFLRWLELFLPADLPPPILVHLKPHV